ncbi:hypothetical protein [Haladaptatus salinisoli]|uniref:hypothetical protein n=1 Tax=Haladaptatus salinisoli TaxID=2884876 RepID=UPI001D0A10C4|nr:hypothetical protein [Haladaptatus salinisoli]
MNVRTDTTRNRIYITRSGEISEDEATRASSKVISGLEKLDPEFAVVNDVTEYEPVSQETKAEIAKVKRVIDDSRVGTVVRVAPESTIANAQMDRAGEVEYDVEVADGVEERLRLLDARE